jgi:glycoside/pentoside/hexuronide:cation symporter, GPH family
MTWRTKSGFGLAEIGLSSVELMLQIYLLELYVVAGLSPLFAGLALALAVFWDAVSDPLMGLISDQTKAKTAVGKRLPYLFVGSALMGVAFAFLFNPPAVSDQWSLFLYLLGMYLLLNTSLTLVGVPHLAIVNDLSESKEERADLFSWRLVCGALGLLLGLSVPLVIASELSMEGLAATQSSLLENRRVAGLVIGSAATLLSVLTGLAVWKSLGTVRSVELETDTNGFSLEHLKLAFKSRTFMLVTTGFALIALGRAFNSSLALMYYKFRLGFSEQQVGALLLVLTIVIMASVPIWLKLSRRYEKWLLCLWGILLLAALTAIAYPLLSPGELWPVLMVAAVGGSLVACVALLESLFSDVVEADENDHQVQLSGAYYGLWKMATKVSRALGLVVAGLLLSWIGFVEGSTEQTVGVQRGIAWAFGPGVALFFGLGAWFIYRSNQPARESTTAFIT